jgi:hypothetical protein
MECPYGRTWVFLSQNKTAKGSRNRIEDHTCYQFLGWPVAEFALARLFVFLDISISVSLPWRPEK